MAKIIAGLGCSHAPSIARAYDRRETEEKGWKPLFDAFTQAQRWLTGLQPDALVVIYNDHIDQYFLDSWPTFAIGTGDSFQIADEGWFPRSFPPVPGHPALARHLAQELVEAGFDLTVAHRQVVDHGVLSPLPLIDSAWAIPIVPLAVNVIWSPLPTPRRCWELGQAIGKAVKAFDDGARIVVVGTGGLSHQLTGRYFGEVRAEWDREFLRIVDEEADELQHLTMEKLSRQGGEHSVEVVQWIAMRGSLPPGARTAFMFYYPYQIMGYGVMGLVSGESSDIANEGSS